MSDARGGARTLPDAASDNDTEPVPTPGQMPYATPPVHATGHRVRELPVTAEALP
ncbi:hypothetical protein GCM10020295_75100 [Streptomyces cinereospinus]